MDADITEVLDNAMNESRVFINGSLMTSGSTYTFKLGKFYSLSVNHGGAVQIVFHDERLCGLCT